MNESALSELPGGWVWTTIGDISDLIHYGYTASSTTESVGPKMLRITDIQNNTVNWETVPYCRIEEEEKQKYLLREGDLVFARTGATVGKSFLIRGKIPEAVFASYLIRIILQSNIEKVFVYNFFQSSKYWLQIHEGQIGIGQPNVNSQILSRIALPLPPLPEQRRIVTKIEELFTRLDAGVEELKKTQAQLKRYRESVLKAACEGKLVPTEAELAKAEGRAYEPADVLLARILKERREKSNGKGKYKEPAALDTRELPAMPEGWIWTTSRTLSWYVTSGSRDWKKYYSNSGALFIRTQDINKNELNLDNVAFVALPDKVEGKRSIVQKNDILIIITGANVGKVALVYKDISEAYVSQSVALMKLVMPNIAKFIHLALIAEGFGKTHLDKMVYGMGRPVLSLENVQDIILPLPPLAEQRRIVAEVERRLSVADEVARTVEHSLAQAQRLRQSILKKAFEGRLVAQDTNDEPAGVLLERIKAEKARNGKDTRKSRRTKDL